MHYHFHEIADRPGFIEIIDPVGNTVAHFVAEHAAVVQLMYANLYEHDQKQANHFMYGHIMGVTYAQIYSDHYPKISMPPAARLTTSDGRLN